MGILDDLYAHLGSASEAEHRLGQEDEQALAQIEAREQELQTARADAEGDQRQLQAIDSELRELTEAYQTITERQGTDASQQPDQKPLPGSGDPGDRHDPEPGR